MVDIPKQLKIKPHFREGTNDSILWKEVFNKNVYKVTEEDLKGSVVIDIGSHIGAFTALSICWGARKVLAVDPCSENMEVFNHNIYELGLIEKAEKLYENEAKIIKYTKGLWTSYRSISVAAFPLGHAGRINTGGCHTLEDNSSSVSSTTIDSLLFHIMIESDVKPPYKLIVKSDCEGAEAALFLHLEHFANDCDLLVGEYHLQSPTFIQLMKENGLENVDHLKLKEMLEPYFKSVEVTEPCSNGRGMFYARGKK